MVKPTVHFLERWVERVSPRAPGYNELQGILAGAVCVQRQQDLLTREGEHYRVLGSYWHPELGLFFKVDEKARKVVTVLTPELARARHGSV